jgi:hypothetical protein
MKQSQLIVLFAGSTPNFAWEIGEAFRNSPFVPTVLLLPFFRKYRNDEVDRFLTVFSSASDLVLPSDLRKIRAVYFSHKDYVLPIVDEGTGAEDEMNKANPFLCSLGRVVHREDPLWSHDYGAMIRDNNDQIRKRTRIVILAILGIYLLIGLMRTLAQ